MSPPLSRCAVIGNISRKWVKKIQKPKHVNIKWYLSSDEEDLPPENTSTLEREIVEDEDVHASDNDEDTEE